MKKFQIFDQTHGRTSLEKCKFCDFFKSAFLWSRKASFLSRTLPNTFLRPNEADKLKKKANYATVLNSCFCGQERLAFHLKRHQTHF